MLELNLLPPEEKLKIATHKNMRRVFRLGSYSLLAVLIFLGLMTAVWWYLQIQLQSAQNILAQWESGPQGQELSRFAKDAEKINSELKNLDRLQGEGKRYSDYLENLIELAPAGIRFKNISMTNEGKIALGGHADTRDILISFKDAIEKSPDFTSLDSPLSNLLKQNDIDFVFNFLIKQNQ